MYSASKALANSCDELQKIRFAFCFKNAVPRGVVVMLMAREVCKPTGVQYANGLVMLDFCSCKRKNRVSVKK